MDDGRTTCSLGTRANRNGFVVAASVEKTRFTCRDVKFIFSCFFSAVISPFVFLWITFRVLSFALITSILRYWAIPLYIVLVLGSISAGVFFNRKDRNFAIRGLKSVLNIGSFPDFPWFTHFVLFSWSPIRLQVWNCLPSILGNLELPDRSHVDGSGKTAWFGLGMV